jgi:HK97 family phage prohead protease
MAERITKSFSGAVTKDFDAAQGLVTAIFSATNNLDRQDDVIEAGAFQNVIANGKLPVLVFGHQWDSLDAILGQTVSWCELMPGDYRLPGSFQMNNWGGVEAVLQFSLNTPSGAAAFEHLKAGVLVEYSFAFEIADAEYDAKAGIRRIKSIGEVFEISVVLIGANPATTTVAMKHQGASAHDRFLTAEAEYRFLAAQIERLIRNDEVATARANRDPLDGCGPITRAVTQILSGRRVA